MTTERRIRDSLCDKPLVVAIHVGNTYSVYAISFNVTPYDIRCNRHPPRGQYRVPTVLLLNDKKEFVAFGYEAEELYEQYAEDGTHGNFYYCRRFTMSLHTSVRMDINCKIKDVKGKEVEALLVFSESIKCLKNEAEDVIGIGTLVESSDIAWVLTVPAMWTDSEKQFMRKAAEKAGIKDENLKIVLELEAASVLYMHMNFLPTDKRNNKVKNDEGFQFGSKYLAVVLGDDTVDIALHQMVDETSLRELVPPCGGHFTGATAVDNYVRLLEGIVGKDVFKSFAEEYKDELRQLYADFAVKKMTFGDNCKKTHNGSQYKTNMTTHIAVPVAIVRKLKEMYPAKNINNEIEKDDKVKGKMAWRGDSQIMIRFDLFASLFETSLEWIINEIDGVLRNAADVEAILLVGDCAESPVIHTSVKSLFPNKKVIVPENAEFAVLIGSVIYGHFPTTVVSRVARHSYGIRVYRDFIPDLHPGEKLVVIGTKRKCKDVFAVHVKKGQELRVGEVQSSQRYTRLHRGQKSLIFDFFISTSENPEYVTDEGCEELGQLEVELDSRSMSVFVWLKYGGTELEAECFDEVTRQKTKATFKFFKE